MNFKTALALFSIVAFSSGAFARTKLVKSLSCVSADNSVGVEAETTSGVFQLRENGKTSTWVEDDLVSMSSSSIVDMTPERLRPIYSARVNFTLQGQRTSLAEVYSVGPFAIRTVEGGQAATFPAIVSGVKPGQPYLSEKMKSTRVNCDYREVKE